jgi:hypothetical protein
VIGFPQRDIYIDDRCAVPIFIEDHPSGEWMMPGRRGCKNPALPFDKWQERGKCRARQMIKTYIDKQNEEVFYEY